MLLSQEPVNLYMTFALSSFGVTSLNEKYSPIYCPVYMCGDFLKLLSFELCISPDEEPMRFEKVCSE